MSTGHTLRRQRYDNPVYLEVINELTIMKKDFTHKIVTKSYVTQTKRGNLNPSNILICDISYTLEIGEEKRGDGKRERKGSSVKITRIR